jgi:hypothetical protein
MVRRVKVPTRNLFLTADGVATRLAIRELKKAKIDPGPLLAKAGISVLKFGEEPKRVGVRAGFLTSAASRGASIFKMMDVSRHRSVDTLRGYVRDAELFKDHAGAGLL